MTQILRPSQTVPAISRMTSLILPVYFAIFPLLTEFFYLLTMFTDVND